MDQKSQEKDLLVQYSELEKEKNKTYQQEIEELQDLTNEIEK